jgi:hypothetical protein
MKKDVTARVKEEGEKKISLYFVKLDLIKRVEWSNMHSKTIQISEGHITCLDILSESMTLILDKNIDIKHYIK